MLFRDASGRSLAGVWERDPGWLSLESPTSVCSWSLEDLDLGKIPTIPRTEQLAVPKLLEQTWFILNPSFLLGVWNFARQRVPMGLASHKDPGHGSLMSFHGGCHHNLLLEKLSLSCMFPDRSTLAPKI